MSPEARRQEGLCGGCGLRPARLEAKKRSSRPGVRKTNIRYLNVSSLPVPADFATIDVSFISLRLVLPAVKTLLSSGAPIIALIKPQFEVGKGKVGKGGVVRSQQEHMRVIDEISTAGLGLGYQVGGVIESPLLGPKGNKEFFIHLKGVEISDEEFHVF